MAVDAHRQLTQQHNCNIDGKVVRCDEGDGIPRQISFLRRIVDIGDVECVKNLGMSRNAYARLCYLVEHVGGLNDSRHISIQDNVAMFLTILRRQEKNRVIGHGYMLSGHTFRKNFLDVLSSVMKLYPILQVKPTPVSDDSTDEKWKYFKGCLGALDGTHFSAHVSENEKARYRTRKGITAIHLLGVCDRDMKFVYALSGWEGSASDSRVLRDALARPDPFKVPRGCYYLCDYGFPNAEGFLTPYTKVRYHLKTWESVTPSPQDYKEYFNMKHAFARQVIEQAFQLLKKRWAILESPASFDNVKVQNLVILACTLLHNFVLSELPMDPLENLTEEKKMNSADGEPDDYITDAKYSSQWLSWRDNLAKAMYHEWKSVG